MPSTRSPPLKITFPSMRVVAPIRLSMRFCGLLVLLNIVSLLRLLQAHRVRCPRLRRSGLVDSYLHAFHLRFRAYPESPFDPPEVLESNRKAAAPASAGSGKLIIALLPPFLQIDHQLEAPLEIAFAPVLGVSSSRR